MRVALTLAIVMLMAGLAGCVGDDAADPGASGGDAGGPGGGSAGGSDGSGGPAVSSNWAELALPYDEGHNHSDPKHHVGLSTPNFEVVGYDPLMTSYHGANSGGYFCGGTASTKDRELAVVNSFSSDIAVTILDVTDPENPQLVGELALPRTHVYDADIVPDGSYVVLATNPPETATDEPQSEEAPATMTIRPRFTDACGNVFDADQEEEAPYGSGVVLVDLADVTNPTVADYYPMPVLGAHSVFATMIDGTRYVLGSTTNLVHQASYFAFLTIEELPSGPQFLHYGTYDAQYPGTDETDALVNGHVDGWIQQHPVTGQLLGYLANWNGGLIVVELVGRGQLSTVSVWNDYDPSKGSGMTGQIHDALPIDGLWDDRHYTFIGQEITARPVDRPTGQVIVLDTTDPANATPVARWTLPVDVTWNASLMFSTHYIELVDRTLFVSMYHGGVWAVDVSSFAGSTELSTLGVFIPDREAPKVRPGAENDFGGVSPFVLDVLALPDGKLVSFDARTGAYILEFDRSMKLPIPLPWAEDAWIGRG